MPRVPVENDNRLSLRVPAEEKAILLRTAALKRTDLTDFVRQHSLEAARAVIREQEHMTLSARDSMRVLELLENAPAPNAKLRGAAKALPKRYARKRPWSGRAKTSVAVDDKDGKTVLGFDSLSPVSIEYVRTLEIVKGVMMCRASGRPARRKP